MIYGKSKSGCRRRLQVLRAGRRVLRISGLLTADLAWERHKLNWPAGLRIETRSYDRVVYSGSLGRWLRGTHEEC